MLVGEGGDDPIGERKVDETSTNYGLRIPESERRSRRYQSFFSDETIRPASRGSQADWQMGDRAGSERMAKNRDSAAKGNVVDGERVRRRLKRHKGGPRLTNKQQTIMATILRGQR